MLPDRSRLGRAVVGGDNGLSLSSVGGVLALCGLVFLFVRALMVMGHPTRRIVPFDFRRAGGLVATPEVVATPQVVTGVVVQGDVAGGDQDDGSGRVARRVPGPSSVFSVAVGFGLVGLSCWGTAVVVFGRRRFLNGFRDVWRWLRVRWGGGYPAGGSRGAAVERP